MEHTFMTIHNLTPDCSILFASESINVILGWRPEDVRGRSVFDYFHPHEVPYARSIHSRGVLLDKAASLHYARILSADGQWVSCECCFTVVHDVLVACTSIYRQGEKSERRAIEGAQIRRIFSSSPRDPRYHMLEHLSPKFKTPPMEREPRAALILNRFTRNLTIMFATNAVALVLGLSPEQLKDKSFYRCIQERCLHDALRCLESAKGNDSIAYLRFWSRDPREEEDFDDDGSNEDEPMPEVYDRGSTSDSDSGGAALEGQMDLDGRDNSSPEIKKEDTDDSMEYIPSANGHSSGHASSSLNSSGQSAHPPAYEAPRGQRSQAPEADDAGHAGLRRIQRQQRRQPLPSVEIEAVVSCTSDGLVVVLRRARPAVPPAHPPLVYQSWEFENGLFAAPWGQQPIRPHIPPEMLYNFQSPLQPHYMPARDNARVADGPPFDYLMRSIREVAVFAWGLVGINGNLAAYSHGRALGEAAPPGGLPIWDPNAVNSVYQPPENQAAARWAALENGSDRISIPPTLASGSYHDPSYASSSHHRGQQYAGDNYLPPSQHAYHQQPYSNGNGYVPRPEHYMAPLGQPSLGYPSDLRAGEQLAGSSRARPNHTADASSSQHTNHQGSHHNSNGWH